MALAASFVATHIYFASIQEGEEAVVKEGDAWMMVGGLSGGLLCFEAAFLLLMKSGYKKTFFSTQTGYQYVQSKFLREGDENKKAVFKYVRAKRGLSPTHTLLPPPAYQPDSNSSTALAGTTRSSGCRSETTSRPGPRKNGSSGRRSSHLGSTKTSRRPLTTT